MKIDRRLNLVFPVEREDGTTLYVHATPISRVVFEKYHLHIAKAFSAIYSEGLNIVSGPRVAALMLRESAAARGQLEGPQGVQHGLIGEIHRLANVVMPAPQGGWAVVPFHDAMTAGVLDEDDVSEVENLLVFFTCLSVMHHRKDVASHLSGMKLWDAQTTSSDCTVFASSLPTSTPAENSGARMTASLVPS